MSESGIDFHVASDTSVISNSVPTQRLFEITLRAPQAAARATRPAYNLALVLDISGSMAGDKLAYTKRAATYLLDQLRENDRAALVVYDTGVQVLAEMQPITLESRGQLLRKVDSLKSGSMTNLSGGWLEGCRQVGLVQANGAVNRALLLSDGLANVGITDREELGEHARQLSQRGVTTSTFGAGSDYDEHLLEVMANQGDGNYYYIDNPAAIPEIFRRELEEIAAITLQEITLTVSIPPHTSMHLPGEWRTQQSDGEMKIYIGDLASGQQRSLYLDVLAPPSDDAGLEFKLALRARTPQGEEIHAEAQVKLDYRPAAEVEIVKRDPGLLDRYYRVSTAQVASEAMRLERDGRREEAERLLDHQLMSAMPFMAQDVQQDYQALRQRIKRGMGQDERKKAQMDQYLTKRGKTRDA